MKSGLHSSFWIHFNPIKGFQTLAEHLCLILLMLVNDDKLNYYDSHIYIYNFTYDINGQKNIRFDAIGINLELQMIYEKVFTTTLIKVLVTY